MHNKHVFTTIILITFATFFNCKTKKVNEKNMQNNEIITYSSEETTDKIYNLNKTKLLILKYKINKSPIINYSYQVIDVKTKKELKKGVFTGEKIEWLDNNTLRCKPYVGVEVDNNELLEGNKKRKIDYIKIKINSI